MIVGGGAAGLSAAYTLQSYGLDAVLLESAARVGGRMGGDRVEGFFLDKGADFFCSSYDVAFRLCEELGLPLIRLVIKLGWYRNGRWVTTTPGLSAGNLLRNLPAVWRLGMLSPRAVRPAGKLFREMLGQRDYLSFAGDSRLAELDGDQSFGDYLRTIGAPEPVRVTLEGFLEMTMGHVELSAQAYMRTYLLEMLLNADRIWAPEKGAAALSEALADACSDVIRVSTPVRKVVIRDGVVAGVIVDEGFIEADAVICAVPATEVPEIIPDLPEEIHRILGNVTYSSGCRVVIGLEHPPLPVGWSGALSPEDDSPLLLDRSVNLPLCVPRGKSTLDLLVGRDRAAELIPLDDEEIKRQVLEDAHRHPPPGSRLPTHGEGLFSRVYRWKEAVCMGPPGMFTAVADIPRQLSQSIKNLFLAGDYTRVPSVNGALASGVHAAEKIAHRLSTTPTKKARHNEP